MLILTRRLHESIILGDDITITVLGVKGGQVRLGIDAPETVPVHRIEIHERLLKETSKVKPPKEAYEVLYTTKNQPFIT